MSESGLALGAIASGNHGVDPAYSDFATNGHAYRSPDVHSTLSVLLAEIILTGVFLHVILGSTDGRAPRGITRMSIGLTLIHLVQDGCSSMHLRYPRPRGGRESAQCQPCQVSWTTRPAFPVPARNKTPPGPQTGGCFHMCAKGDLNPHALASTGT